MTDNPKTNEEIIEYFVCGDCGGPLSLITVDAEPEVAYCAICSRTGTGVRPEIYEIAKEYIQTFPGRGYYSYDTIADSTDRERRNIGSMCCTVQWLKDKLEGAT